MADLIKSMKSTSPLKYYPTVIKSQDSISIHPPFRILLSVDRGESIAFSSREGALNNVRYTVLVLKLVFTMMDPNMSAMGSNSGSSNPFGAPPPPPPSHEIGNPFGASVSATAPATHSTSAPLQDPWTATGTSQASTNSLAAGTQNPFGVPLAPQNSVPMDTNNIISNNINNTMKMNMGETGIGMGNGNGYAAPYGAQTFQQTSPTLQPQAHPSTDSFLTSQHSKQFQQSQYSQPSQYSQQTQSQNPFGAPPTPAPATMNAGVNMTTGLNAHAPGMNATSITNQAPPNNPFGSVIVTPAPPSFATPQSSQFYTNNGSMILSQTQSNPYAMGATKTGTSVATHPNQLVAQQAQPWALPSAAPLPPNSYHPPYTHHPQQQQMVLAPTTTVTSYDPFGTQSCGLVLAHPPEPVNQELDMFFQPGAQNPTPSLQIEQQNDGSIDPPGISANGQPKDPPPRNDIPEDEMDEARSERKALPNMVASPNGTTYPPQIEYGHRPGGKNGNDEDDQQNRGASPRNPYAPALAREAPPGASPLPKAELVRKRGFVLGRISFRTIVMKKWKQTYWVQYGPHTMLWFRSQADFDDWLNNPYHVQTERNFLIKLAVNFVHDLYKPNVRGYQVTQCRSKGYGNKVIRQFKLERWMDYGPTIAAAFGSYNPAEVDALREAVVECMRNTPLNGGIRATGAVRQPNPAERNEDESEFNFFKFIFSAIYVVLSFASLIHNPLVSFNVTHFCNEQFTRTTTI